MKKMRWIFLGIGLVIILFIFGWMSFTIKDNWTQATRFTKIMFIGPTQNMLQVQDELLRINPEPNFILKIIQEEIEQWNTPTKTKTFKLVNSFDSSQQVVGLYHSLTEWELTGNIDTNKRFQMKSQSDTVKLEYEQVQTLLATEEFTFLIPLHHLLAIEEVLQSTHDQQIVWQKGEQYWNVTIESSLRSLSDDIHYFLFHGTNAKGLIDKPLADFSLRYTLAFSIQNNHFVLDRFQFTLDKQLRPLNQLEFIL